MKKYDNDSTGFVVTYVDSGNTGNVQVETQVSDLLDDCMIENNRIKNYFLSCYLPLLIMFNCIAAVTDS